MLIDAFGRGAAEPKEKGAEEEGVLKENGFGVVEEVDAKGFAVVAKEGDCPTIVDVVGMLLIASFDPVGAAFPAIVALVFCLASASSSSSPSSTFSLSPSVLPKLE